jgi:hypothetical protein
MFDKYRAKKKRAYYEPVVELIEKQQGYLKEAQEKYEAAQACADDAEKVLKLKGLISDVDSAAFFLREEQGALAQRYADRRANRAYGTIVGTTTAACAVPAALIAPPIAIGVGAAVVLGLLPAALISDYGAPRKERKMKKENPALVEVHEALTAQRIRAEEALAQTIKNCDLDKIAKSPSFEEAFDQCEPLQKRFRTAAAVRAALGGEDAQQGGQKAGAASRAPSPPKGGYGHLNI